MENKFDVLGKSNGGEALPFELVKLPSKGKLYPQEHPFHNCEAVDIKAMTAHEENILTTPALLKKGTVLSVLISSCLMNKLVDPANLLIGDKTALLLAIRITGFGGDYRAKVTCGECNKQFDHTFDLSQVQIKFLETEPLESGKNLFSYKLPKSGATVKFSLLTDGDDAEITKTQQNRSKALEKMNRGAATSVVETNVTDRLIKAIKSINDVEDQTKIVKFVNSMPAYDSKSLRTYINKIQPDMIMDQNAECPHCNSVEEQTIPMSLEFFWPDWNE